MPVEIAATSTFRAESFPCARPNGRAEKSGELDLVGPAGVRQGVQVNVYRTSSEHFAVIYPQAKHCRPLGVLNLRNTTCQRLSERSRCGVVLRQRGFDNTAAVTFLSDYPSELDAWAAAFTWRVQQPVRQCSMPVLEEDEEC